MVDPPEAKPRLEPRLSNPLLMALPVLLARLPKLEKAVPNGLDEKPPLDGVGVFDPAPAPIVPSDAREPEPLAGAEDPEEEPFPKTLLRKPLACWPSLYIDDGL